MPSKHKYDKVSDCCGAGVYSNGDSDTEDIGVCPDCKEHCEYVSIEEEEDDDSQTIIEINN